MGRGSCRAVGAWIGAGAAPSPSRTMDLRGKIPYSSNYSLLDTFLKMQSEPKPFPKLFLIRHGATDWSESRQHTGLTDIELNANGEKSARELKKRLAREKFDLVFTSPLLRARRTCELSGYLGQAKVEPGLVEWDYGIYEGLTTIEIQKKQPDWNLFRDGAPNGETPEQVATRADRFVDSVRRLDCNVAAFSSGHMIRMIAVRWLKLKPEAARCFVSSTASLSVLGYEHDLNEPTMLLWNEVQRRE